MAVAVPFPLYRTAGVAGPVEVGIWRPCNGERELIIAGEELPYRVDYMPELFDGTECRCWAKIAPDGGVGYLMFNIPAAGRAAGNKHSFSRSLLLDWFRFQPGCPELPPGKGPGRPSGRGGLTTPLPPLHFSTPMGSYNSFC